MSVRKIMLLVAVVAFAVTAMPVAAAHHGKRKHVDPVRIKWSAESRRLAEACRSDPSSENRTALRRQLESDFDDFIGSLRSKIHSDKLSREQRRRLDSLSRERERTVNAEMRRLLNDRDPDSRDKKDKKTKTHRKSH